VKHRTRVHLIKPDHCVALVAPELAGASGWVTCSCGWRSDIRTALAGQFAMRRAIVRDELRHLAEVDAA